MVTEEMVLNQKPVPNFKQQECIDNINGKYLVLAGPGTGKTFTIVQRIKHIIETGVKPEKVLCLTFTDAAASEMKKRIEKELNLISSDVNVFTYHGFCMKIIEENPDIFELPQNYKIVNNAMSKALIKSCIDEINPKALRTDKNDPYFYINKIKNSISKIKQYRLTKEQYFKNLEQNPDWIPEIKRIEEKINNKIQQGKKLAKNDESDLKDIKRKIEQAKEIWQFYELYNSKMEARKYLDFNDMINLVLNKFDSSPIFLEKEANRYEYLLVDEYQDTNPSQNAIVFNLVHGLNSQNIFVVGDDDQIIYGFQGAKLDTMEKFLIEFSDTKVICLEENMRSTQTILDVSRNLIQQDNLRLEGNPKFEKYNISKKLISANKNLKQYENPVRFHKYADTMQEYNHIVDEIEQLIKSQKEKDLSEIAILCRSNKELEEFCQMFKERNIPSELKEGKNIFKISAVNVLLMYIQFLVNPELYSHRILQYLLSYPFNINPKDYLKIYEKASTKRNFIDALKDIPKQEFVEFDKINKFIETYDYLSSYKMKENIKNTVLEIGSKTGIFDYYLNTDINRSESIAGLKKFVDEAAGFSEIYNGTLLDEFVDYIHTISEDDEEILTDKSPVKMNAVQLCTYHSAKGREFNYVYMPTLINRKWESSSYSLKSEIPLDISEYKDDSELKAIKYSENAKLMYVGMTRAKHSLYLSCPQTDGRYRKTSSLLNGIQNMADKTDFEYTQKSYDDECAKIFIKKDYDYIKEFQTFIDAKLADRAYSASAINTYLACPRQYLYEKILGFNSKDGNPDYASYGTAIHSACEFAVKQAKINGAYPSKDLLIEEFIKVLSNQPMSNYEQRQNFEGRGIKTLNDYYVQFLNTPINRLYDSEMEIHSEYEGINFVGYIDRIDKNDDETYTIYDYKTGNAKDGITPNGKHSNYYNQMALYKYFFEKETNKKVSKNIFLYPDDKSKNSFELSLTDEECKNVLDIFKQAVSDIKSYKYHPTNNPDVCKYCSYQGFCQMDII